MSLPASPHAQRGATLVVGLIMLLLITLVVSSAFTLSGTNLKSVGNMQLRDEAIAAANIAVEQVIGSSFTTAPTAESINVDINNDSATDYVVSIATPVCIRESEVISVVAGQESGLRSTLTTPPSKWNTVWSLDATVSDSASGASAHVRSGVRVLLTQTEKDLVCP